MLELKRCETDDEIEVALGVYNDVWTHDRIAMADLRPWQQSMRDYVDVVATRDDRTVGAVVGLLRPTRPDRVLVILSVLADDRRHGVGSQLYDAVSAWSRERGVEQLEAQVRDDDVESIEFAQRRGFVEESRDVGVVLALAGLDAPQVAPPPGIEIVTWAEQPGIEHGLYEVALEGVPDIPGYEEDEVEPYEEWLEAHMRGGSDRPDATFVALAGDEVVGYAKLSLTTAQPDVAFHDLSAVKRAWRGRGIARALKARQIGWAIANGYQELRTNNEERNEPIRRLNAEFGYRPGVGRVFMVGPAADLRQTRAAAGLRGARPRRPRRAGA